MLENRAWPASAPSGPTPDAAVAFAEGFDSFSEARTSPLPVSILTGARPAGAVVATVAVTPADPAARPAEAVASGVRTCRRTSSRFEATASRFCADPFGRARFEDFADVALEGFGFADEAEGSPLAPAGVLVGLEAGAAVTAATAATGLVAAAEAVSTAAEAAGVVTDTAAKPASEVDALTSAVTETEPTFTARKIPDFLGGERSSAAAVPA